METVAKKHTHYSMKNRKPVGICLMTQGIQTRLPDDQKEWGVVGVGRQNQEEGDICIPMADSRWHMAEINTTLWSNYPSVKNKFFKFLAI